MNLRPLGTTGLKVSEVGIGCWQLGGQGWGAVSAKQVIHALDRALDLGINLFDTAPVYGFGRSEELLGKALRGRGSDAVIVSKGGLAWDTRGNVRHDSRPASLRVHLEDTLRRLGRDFVDVYLLHWPDPAVPLEESLRALESFRREGKVRAWGVCNSPAPDVLRLDGDRIVLEYPWNWLGDYADEYRASAASARELLPSVASRGWAFLAFDVLARGLLAGRHDQDRKYGKRDIRSRDPRFRGVTLEKHRSRVAELAALARQLGAPPAALAIRAALDQQGVTACIVGVKSRLQVEENASVADLELTEEARTALAASRLDWLPSDRSRGCPASDPGPP